MIVAETAAQNGLKIRLQNSVKCAFQKWENWGEISSLFGKSRFPPSYEEYSPKRKNFSINAYKIIVIRPVKFMTRGKLDRFELDVVI